MKTPFNAPQRPGDTAGDTAVSAFGLSALVSTLLACAIVTILGAPRIVTVAQEHFTTASAPYWQDSSVATWLAPTLIVLATFVFFLTPGLLVGLLWRRDLGLSGWVTLALALAVVLTFALSSATKAVLGFPLHQNAFGGAWLALSATLLAAVVWRAWRHTLHWPLAGPAAKRRLLVATLLCFGGLFLLAPKLFWESFQVDGIEAFEAGRSLSRHFLPQYQLREETFGFLSHWILFAIPNHFFGTLWGPWEVSARAPLLLFVGLLHILVASLAELGARARLGVAAESLIAAGVALFTFVLVFNTSYEPFFSDIASPATPNALALVCFLAAVLNLFQRRWLLFGLFGVFAYISSPSSLLLVVGLAIGLVVASRTLDDPRLLAVLALAGLYALMAALYETAYVPLLLDGNRTQFSPISLAARLYPPSILHVSRFSAILIPCGLLPAVALFLTRRDNVLGVALSVTSLVYFGVLYLSAWTAPHQFTPAMLLPSIVFWNLYVDLPPARRRGLALLTIAGIGTGVFLAVPTTFVLNGSSRDFGYATRMPAGSYDRDYQHLASDGHLIRYLLPEDYKLIYPHQPWGTDSLSWIYYGSRRPDDARTAYVLQARQDPEPEGAALVGENEHAALWVVDEAQWHRHREQRFEQSAYSPAYGRIVAETTRFWRSHAESRGSRVRAEPLIYDGSSP